MGIGDEAANVRDSLRKNAMRLSSTLVVADNVNGRLAGGAYSDDGID